VTLILVLKGVATRVQTYSIVFDEIWYTDLQQWRTYEFCSGSSTNSGWGQRERWSGGR